MSTCPHPDCRDQEELDVISGKTRCANGIDNHYAMCAARSYFASRALEALDRAGAPRDLIRRVEEFRTTVGNTGD